VTDIDHDAQLRRTLEDLNEAYDPAVDLIEEPFSSPGYHTTLAGDRMVHPTRQSLTYALVLLDAGDPDDERRAVDVLEAVLDLQDRDPDSDTYGIWPWFYEEPLAEMSPPDWNWADFLGKRLLLIRKRHGDRLSDDVADRLRESVFAACDAIVERDVGPGYTNIAVMGAFVTLVAGEVFDREDYHAYGLERLERFYDYTTEADAFEEYNSPTYTVVAVTELSSIYTETETAAARDLAAELRDLGWRTIAEHFHPATEQWAGPHSRAYSTLTRERELSFVRIGTEGEAAVLPATEIDYDPLWYGNDVRCPEEYRSLFTTPEERRVHDRYGEAGGRPLTATTHLTEGVALGTFDRSITWDQRRPVVAHVDNDGAPTFVRLRVLKDGRDFSSGVTTAAQGRGNAVVGVNFATDGGDFHPSLDPTEGSVDVEDLRLRIEAGGSLEGVVRAGAEGAAPGDDYRLEVGDHSLRIGYLRAGFGDETIATELTETEAGTVAVDHVIHDGDERTIDLAALDDAAFGFVVGTSAPDAAVDEDGETLEMSATTAFGELSVSIPRSPAPEEELFERNEATVRPS